MSNLYDLYVDLWNNKYSINNVVTPEKPRRTLNLPEETARKALELVGINASGDEEKRLIDFLKERFSECYCCVLSMKSTAFKKLGINIGTQELIINEYLAFLYTPNYESRPVAISEAN